MKDPFTGESVDGPVHQGYNETYDGMWAIVRWDNDPDYLRTENDWTIHPKVKRSQEFEYAIVKCLKKITMMGHCEVRTDHVYYVDYTYVNGVQVNIHTTREVRGVFIPKHMKQYTSTVEQVHNCANDFIDGWDAATKIQRLKEKAAQDIVDAKKAVKLAKKAQKERDAAEAEHEKSYRSYIGSAYNG